MTQQLLRSAAAGRRSAVTPIFAVRRGTDKAAGVIIHAALVVALIPLVGVLFSVITQGAAAVGNAKWWTKSQLGIVYNQEGGGALHAIIGTLLQAGISSAISIPIGVFTAIYLVEYAQGGRLGAVTTFMVDILSGVPSIVAALFVYSAWVVLFGFSRSGMAVSLALVLLMVPVIVRNTEEMLRIVPQDLREAAYALGVPKWKTIATIVVPTALSGIITGIMLALSRVMGESAPVLILVGSTSAINLNPMDNPQSSLPLMMLDMYKAGGLGVVGEKMWGAAFTLLLLITVVNISARVISARFAPLAH